MQARVTTLTLQRDKADEASAILRRAAPDIKQQKGFGDILVLADRATGKSTLITLWENEADLKASETSGFYAARLAELAPLCTVLPTREVCDVFVHDLSTIGDGAKFARATTVLFQRGKLDEGIRIVRESVLPAARQQQGYHGLLGVVDRGTGKGITCGFWESEAAIKANETNGYYQAQLAKVLPLIAGQPTREVFELSLPALVPAPVMQAQPHAPAP